MTAGACARYMDAWHNMPGARPACRSVPGTFITRRAAARPREGFRRDPRVQREVPRRVPAIRPQPDLRRHRGRRGRRRLDGLVGRDTGRVRRQSASVPQAQRGTVSALNHAYPVGGNVRFRRLRGRDRRRPASALLLLTPGTIFFDKPRVIRRPGGHYSDKGTAC